MRVLITGGRGQLGVELAQHCTSAGDQVWAPGHGEFDISDRDQVLGGVTTLRPDLVINAAAWTAVDACEADRNRALVINGLGPRWVAEACRRVGAHLVHVSTDYVFPGVGDRPYHEWDSTGPINVYGESKLAGEREVISSGASAAVVRTSWVCGLYGPNFVATVLRLARSDTPLRFVDDQRGCPTFTPSLAPVLRSLGAARVPGVVHAVNDTAMTWCEFARAVLVAAGQDPARVTAITTEELQPARPARRPTNSVLATTVLDQLGLGRPGAFEPALRALVEGLIA